MRRSAIRTLGPQPRPALPALPRWKKEMPTSIAVVGKRPLSSATVSAVIRDAATMWGGSRGPRQRRPAATRTKLLIALLCCLACGSGASGMIAAPAVLPVANIRGPQDDIATSNGDPSEMLLPLSQSLNTEQQIKLSIKKSRSGESTSARGHGAHTTSSGIGKRRRGNLELTSAPTATVNTAGSSSPTTTTATTANTNVSATFATNTARPNDTNTNGSPTATATNLKPPPSPRLPLKPPIRKPPRISSDAPSTPAAPPPGQLQASPQTPPPSAAPSAQCGAPPLRQLPLSLSSQQGLRSCPLVVSYLVRPPLPPSPPSSAAASATNGNASDTRGQGSNSGAAGAKAASGTGAGKDGGSGGTKAPPSAPVTFSYEAGPRTAGSGGVRGGNATAAGGLLGSPLCSWGVLINNGRGVLYSWQLVWRFTSLTAYHAGDVEGAVLVTSGDGSPVRVVNAGEATSIAPSGGGANFSMSLSPNTTAPDWQAVPLEWTAVYVNGQRCVHLPSSSLGLPSCGVSYSELAAGSGGHAGQERGPATNPENVDLSLACASIFCCGDLESEQDPPVPSPAPPDSLSQLSQALAQLLSLMVELKPHERTPPYDYSAFEDGDSDGDSRPHAPPSSRPPPSVNVTINGTVEMQAGISSPGTRTHPGGYLSASVVSRLQELVMQANEGADVSVELLETLHDIIRQVEFSPAVPDDVGGSSSGASNPTSTGIGNGTIIAEHPGGAAAANLTLVLEQLMEIIKARAIPPKPPRPPTAPTSPPQPAPSHTMSPVGENDGHSGMLLPPPDMNQAADGSLPQIILSNVERSAGTSSDGSPEAAAAVLPTATATAPTNHGSAVGREDVMPPAPPPPLLTPQLLPLPTSITKPQTNSSRDMVGQGAEDAVRIGSSQDGLEAAGGETGGGGEAKRKPFAVMVAPAVIGACVVLGVLGVVVAVLVVRRRRRRLEQDEQPPASDEDVVIARDDIVKRLKKVMVTRIGSYGRHRRGSVDSSSGAISSAATAVGGATPEARDTSDIRMTGDKEDSACSETGGPSSTLHQVSAAPAVAAAGASVTTLTAYVTHNEDQPCEIHSRKSNDGNGINIPQGLGGAVDTHGPSSELQDSAPFAAPPALAAEPSSITTSDAAVAGVQQQQRRTSRGVVQVLLASSASLPLHTGSPRGPPAATAFSGLNDNGRTTSAPPLHNGANAWVRLPPNPPADLPGLAVGSGGDGGADVIAVHAVPTASSTLKVRRHSHMGGITLGAFMTSRSGGIRLLYPAVTVTDDTDEFGTNDDSDDDISAPPKPPSALLPHVTGTGTPLNDAVAVTGSANDVGVSLQALPSHITLHLPAALPALSGLASGRSISVNNTSRGTSGPSGMGIISGMRAAQLKASRSSPAQLLEQLAVMASNSSSVKRAGSRPIGADDNAAELMMKRDADDAAERGDARRAGCLGQQRPATITLVTNGTVLTSSRGAAINRSRGAWSLLTPASPAMAGYGVVGAVRVGSVASPSLSRLQQNQQERAEQRVENIRSTTLLVRENAVAAASRNDGDGLGVTPACSAATVRAAAGAGAGAGGAGGAGSEALLVDGSVERLPQPSGSLPSGPVGGVPVSGDGGEGASGGPQSLEGPMRNKQTSWVAIDFARDVVLERRLGSGAYGTVYRGTWCGRPVACKVVPLLDGDGGAVCPQAVESIRQEVQVLSRLSHPHIVQFYGACLAPPNVCIVEELAAGGSLHHRLHARRRGTATRLRPPMTYLEVIRLGLEVASAMAYLHPHVVHRDLKPQNVLLDAEGRAKVCDFGIAKIKDRTLLSTRNAQAGTPAYMAPEQFEGRPVSEKVDVYAYGMTLYECLTGEQPWRELQNPMQVIFVVGVQGQRPPLPHNTPTALAHLISACWSDSPEDRPPFTTIVTSLQTELDAVVAVGRAGPWAGFPCRPTA